MAEGDRRFRVCITGSEADSAALPMRLTAGNPGDLHEIRLDLLESVSADVFELIAVHGPRVIATCRPVRENGGFRGTEPERLDLLASAALAGAAYVDLELDSIEAGAAGALPASTAIIGSVHAADMEVARAAASRLARASVAIRKLAVGVRGAADLLALREAAAGLPGPSIVVGMGPAGLWSRLRPGDFGSALTYVASAPGLETAAGQVSLADAEAMGLRESGGLEPFALIGGDNVLGSPGAAAHNRVFRRLGIPFQHVPLPADSWEEAVAACRVLGVSWVAVTMPFKARAIAAGALPDPWAMAAGSSNTRFLGDQGSSPMPGINAWNTDAPASLGLLTDLGLLPGHRLLILGAGATARAIAHAAMIAGAHPILAARHPPSTGAIPWDTVPWEYRHEVRCDALVQTTPLGSDGYSCPWESDRALPPRVMDLALARGEGTVLVQRASDAGAAVRDGLDFWCAQGSIQSSLLTDRHISAGDLAGALVDAGFRKPFVRQVPVTSGGRNHVSVTVPGSKSMTQRCLILAALADGVSRLDSLSGSDDSRELIRCLAGLGTRFAQVSGGLMVIPGPVLQPAGPLRCGEGGTTARFLAALALVGASPMDLYLGRRLSQRPMASMLAALEQAGLDAERTLLAEGARLTIRGSPRVGASIRVEADLSSQFASALMLAASALPDGLDVVLDRPEAAVSRGYLDMTVAVLGEFNVPVLTHDNGYRVGPGRPRGIRCEIEGDASLAAFWQTAGYITTRKVDVTNLKPASIQRDRVFPELLDALDSRGIAEFDLRDTPDLLPPLVVAALFAGRPVRIGGVAHARDKESDRLSVLAREFGRIGARIQVTDDGVFVEPSPLAGGVDLDPHNDHRMAMAFAIAGLRVPGTGILDPGCVSKSYPGFFADLEAFR